jgi:tetratricopeptide (TPR) repeat protein
MSNRKEKMLVKTAKWFTAGLAIATIIGCSSARASASTAPGDMTAPSKKEAVPGQRRSSKKSEKNPDYQYEKGLIALQYGLTDEAIRYGHLGIELDPNHFHSYNLLGSAYYTKGDYAQSVKAYEKAVELKPEVAEIHRNLGLSYLETEQPEKAKPEFQKAYEINGDPEASFYLARLLYQEKEFEESLDYILITIQNNSKSAVAYNLKGVVLNQLGRYQEALGSFQAGLVLAPDDVGLQINLGIAYINTGAPGKAVPVLEKVLPRIKEAALKRRVEEYLEKIK